MDDVVIVGGGGHGRETLDIIEAINSVEPTWACHGFVDDDEQLDTRLIERRGATLLGTCEALANCRARYVIGIGSSAVRARLDMQISRYGRVAATLVHPAATVAADNCIADGVLIAAGAHVTNNVKLGRHVHLNVGAVVSHDCVLGDYTSLAPGVLLNGNVRIGRQVLLGSGAIVTPGVTIGDYAVVGAGAVVLKDVPPGVTVKGIPARV